MPKHVTITNTTNFPISIDVKQVDFSELFTKFGRVTINPQNTFTIEYTRINEGHLQNLQKLGLLKYLVQRVQEIPPAPPEAPAGQTVTLGFQSGSSLKDGDKVASANIIVFITTSDGLELDHEVTVDVSRTGGTAIDGVDFNFTSPTTLTFIAGSLNGETLSADVSILGANNPDCTVILGLSNPTGSGTTISGITSHTLTIAFVGGGGGEA